MVRSGVVLIFFAILIVFAPPGICPCWLNSHVDSYHIHLSKEHAGSEHSHDYLFQLSQTTLPIALPLPITPASLWIALLSAGSLWWLLGHLLAGGQQWQAVPLLPPPKLFAFN